MRLYFGVSVACTAAAVATAAAEGHRGMLRRDGSHLHSPAASSITVNTTTARSGDCVNVSWSEVLRTQYPHLDLLSMPDEHTEWFEDSDGTHQVRVVDSPARSRSGVKTTNAFWIGQFSPAITDISDVQWDASAGGGVMTPPYTSPAPVKFISGSQVTAGHWPFIVTNSRTTVNWVLFEGSISSSAGFRAVAVSPAVSFVDANDVAQIRLARTPSSDEMRVSWTTPSGAASKDLEVQWGLEPAALNRSITSYSTTTYTAADLCGAPANSSGFHDPGAFSTAIFDLSGEPRAQRLAGLTYYYRIGSTAAGFSETFSFLAPKPASPDVPLSVVVTADMGETYEDGSQYHWEEPAAVNTTLGIEHMFSLEGGVDVVMHPGDLSYATGYESEWDRFMEAIEPIAARAPYMTGQGNHERDFPGSGNSIGGVDSGGECGVPTQARFQMPTCAQPNVVPCIGTSSMDLDPSEDPSALRTGGVGGPVGSANDGWYSFDQGPVHFLNLNTEMNSSTGSRQYEFVAADLAAVNRSLTPWVFVFGHRQMYSGNSLAPQNSMGDLEPLLMKYKVDIAFWGHIHFAQQTCAMFQGQCVNQTDDAGYDAPIHVVIGNAGQSLAAFPTPRAAYSLYEGEEWGFSHVQVDNATHLTFSFFGDNGGAEQPPPLHHTFNVVRKYPRV